jgi:hypothetical protein
MEWEAVAGQVRLRRPVRTTVAFIALIVFAFYPDQVIDWLFQLSQMRAERITERLVEVILPGTFSGS